MPQKRNPQDLQSICLEPLVEILWDWWLNNKGKTVSELEEVFQYFRLPYMYTEEVLRMLNENHEVYTGHVCLLLKLGMRKFTLTKLYYVDFDIAMHKVGTSFQNLYELDVSRSRVSLNVLTIMPKVIPNVHVLGLQFTQTNDKILEAIADYCSHLQNLDVSYCPITNTGIEKLCSSKSACRQTLNVLNIIETRVTTKGATSILKNTPSLFELDFQNAIELFVSMHAFELQQGSIEKSTTYNLRTVKFNLEPKSHRIHRARHNFNDDYQLVSEAIHIIVVTCPMLTKAVISEWNPHQVGSLHLLAHCSRLTNLEFNVADYPTLSMVDIHPVLLGRGQHLQCLTIKHVVYVDIVVLCTLCSNLKMLHMEDNSYVSSFPSLTVCFDNLTYFTTLGTIPDEILHQLLVMCHKACDITIHHNYNLTYELLHSVFCKSSFSHIESLNFAECDRFTDDALQLFIRDENELGKITVENCRISYNQYVQLLGWIHKNIPTADINFEFKSRIW